jgi:hypothetical protein
MANSEKENEYHKLYREKNKAALKGKRDKERKSNGDYNKYMREWRAKNKGKLKSNNHYKDKEARNLYRRNRTKIDPLYNLTQSIRSSIGQSFRYKGFNKNCKTEQILSCSFNEFKIYLEKQFSNWMNWENKGKYNGELNFGWDIDHIIPLCTATCEADIIRLNHYSNFQPLCSKINRDIKNKNIWHSN